MCIGGSTPKAPPPPAPPPAQAPAKPSTVDFDAVETDSAKLKKNAAGKKKFRVKPTQNTLGTFQGAAGSGLSIPKKVGGSS